MWDLIVSVPDHSLSFYFGNKTFHSRVSLSVLGKYKKNIPQQSISVLGKYKET